MEMAPAGMGATHRKSVGAALRPAAGVHAASKISREPQRVRALQACLDQQRVAHPSRALVRPGHAPHLWRI
eukprot:15817826-Heterocapsa_arctica.AAC.1